jgi:hypothetical protein
MKPIYIFLLSFAIIAAILFLSPVAINLFDGEVEYKKGLVYFLEKRPLSLGYFIGIGYDPKDMDVVKSFRLLPTGYLLAGIMLVGIPGLIAYRIHLNRTTKDKS